MNLKTYRASSMAEALAQVKKDLGKDAVILHTRAYKVGAIMGVGGRGVVEITASDQAAARQARVSARAAAGLVEVPGTVLRAAPRAVTPVAVLGPEERDEFRPASFSTVRTRAPLAGSEATPELRPDPPADARENERATIETRSAATVDFLTRPPRQVAASQPVSEPARVPASPLAMPAAALASRVTLAPVDDESMRVLHDELSSIKRLIGQVLHCSRTTAAKVGESAAAGGVLALGGMSDPLFSFYSRLQEVQLASEIVESVVGGVRDELSPSELSDESIVRQSVLRRLAGLLPCVGSVARAGMQHDARPLTIALIGPTGVGKTTTIAKLAAMYKLRHGRRVGLVTCDTYRIAAVEQLRTYANIIGLPLKVAMTPGEVSQSIEALTDCDVILLDTAGRSHHDAGRLAELAKFVESARPHETHLVLSVTAQETVLRRAADRFGALKPSRVLLTKLDEAVHLGSALGVARSLSVPISYVTDGQEVPDQIELASADRLARTLLDGGPAA